MKKHIITITYLFAMFSAMGQSDSINFIISGHTHFEYTQVFDGPDASSKYGYNNIIH